MPRSASSPVSFSIFFNFFINTPSRDLRIFFFQGILSIWNLSRVSAIFLASWCKELYCGFLGERGVWKLDCFSFVFSLSFDFSNLATVRSPALFALVLGREEFKVDAGCSFGIVVLLTLGAILITDGTGGCEDWEILTFALHCREVCTVNGVLQRLKDRWVLTGLLET